MNKVLLLNGEKGLECKLYVDGIRLEHVSEFKYLGCVLDESGTGEAEVASERSVAGIIRSPINARRLQLECARVLHEALLFPVRMYGSETMM